MTSIDDSTPTPPGYWFGVIEGRLHQRMRDTLSDLGLRRGSWRILHTLAEGPATADELAGRLPHGDDRPGGGHPHRPHTPGDFGGGRGRAHGYGRHPGWRSQEPRDEQPREAGADAPAAPHEGDPHPHHHGVDDHNHDHGDHHGHNHEHAHTHAYERGYERGFDRGFALGALRGPHAHGTPWPGGPWSGGPWAAHPASPWHGMHPGAPFAGYPSGGPGGPGGPGWGHDGRPAPGDRFGRRPHQRPDREGRRRHRIHRVLAEFVERGWVWFDGDRATLTDEGRAAHDAAFERVQTVRAELVNGIPEADYATALATLEAMARNLGWRPAGDDDLPGEGQAGEPRMDA